MTEQILEAEVVETDAGTELVHQAGTLFHKNDPLEALDEAKRVATGLAQTIKDGGMVDCIDGKEFVKVEGWRTLGSILGVVPRETAMVQIDQGWQATVEAVTLDGRVVGRATSSCTKEEKKRANAPTFELQGMAATRATSRALRGPLGFVMQIAGFQATSAEEMSEVRADADPEAQWDVLPPDAPFAAAIHSAKWINAKGKDKILAIALVANGNGGLPAGEKLWLEPGRADYQQFVQHVCGGMEPPVGGSLDALKDKPFDLTVSLNGKWRNFSIGAATPPEA